MAQGLGITIYRNTGSIPDALNIDKTGICPIDHSPIDDGEAVAVHDGAAGTDRYHVQALREWFALGNNTCPTCRAVLNVSNLIQPIDLEMGDLESEVDEVDDLGIEVNERGDLDFEIDEIDDFGVTAIRDLGIKLMKYALLASAAIRGAVIIESSVLGTQRMGFTSPWLEQGLAGTGGVLSGITCLADAYTDYRGNHKVRALCEACLGIACFVLSYYAFPGIDP